MTKHIGILLLRLVSCNKKIDQFCMPNLKSPLLISYFCMYPGKEIKTFRVKQRRKKSFMSKIKYSCSRTTDNQWEFFSSIPNILADWTNRPNKFWGILGYFWWYYLLKFCHCVSLVCDFALLIHFFCKKLRLSYILHNFIFGIGICFWAVENLESNHHVSVVCAHANCHRLKNTKSSYSCSHQRPFQAALGVRNRISCRSLPGLCPPSEAKRKLGAINVSST